MKQIKNNEANKQKEKDLKDKLMLFDKLPDMCVACHEPFDRKNKDMVQKWTVVVRKEENVVNLYCPPCIAKAKEIIENFKKHVEEKKK